MVTATPAKSDRCLNCGRTIDGENFCPSCGQENDTKIISAGHLLRDVFDEFLKYDAKLLQTLRCLLLKPGFLTNEYIAGRRVRYITPLKLYFMLSTVMFLTFALTGRTREIDRMATARMVKSRSAAGSVTVSVRDGEVLKAGTGVLADRAVSRSERLEADIERVRTRANRMLHWVVVNLASVQLLMIPVTALVLKLLFFRTGRLYVEHLVYAAHLNSFNCLIALPVILVRNQAVETVISGVIGFAYGTFALNSVYRLPNWKAACVSVTVMFTGFAAIFLSLVMALVVMAVYTVALHR